MKQLFFALFLFSFVVFSNAQSSKEQQYNKNVILKVYVDSDAKIFMDGKIVNEDKLKRSLKRILRKKGFVYYSRSFKGSNTKVKSSKILTLIADYKLPVQFYTDNSFSEVADW
tara:strand:+ start:38319 stop:38657 length:339 start_codon:yes stop_codon:yes gene_type:complete